MNKKICILTSVHSPSDHRIFHKEARSLARAGYDVSIIAQHNKSEIVDEVKIIELPQMKKRLQRLLRLPLRALRLALKQKADFYHFHDPELIPIGLALKLLGKKVIYDVHEDVSKQILDKNWIGNKNIRKIVSVFFNIFEKFSVKFFVRVVTATSYIAKRFPKRKTIILRNLPVLKLIENVNTINYKKDKPVMIYAGVLTRIRGIKKIVQAMEFIKEKGELWLLGKWESEGFRKECASLKGWKYIKYLGLRKPNDVYAFLKNADVGICLLYPLERYMVSLPTKAFEYISCSLPIVMSNFPSWKKNFETCALFANPYDAENIASKILYLLNNPDKARELGNKGRQLAEEKYNWEVEQKKLLDIYEDILNK